MVRIRLSIAVLALIAAIVVAGCGGGGSSSGSSSSTLAALASPGSLVFAEGELKPTGELKSNVDAVAKRLAGVNSLGEFVISELESSARQEGEPFDYAREVEPWLGKRGGVAFERLIDGELSEPLIAVQTTDPKAAQAFIDKQTKESSDPSKGVSYEGIHFKVGGPENNAVGLIGETLVFANSEKEFKAAIDASQGDSLGGEDRFQKAIASASNGSFADVYVDVGGIIEQSEDEIDAQTKEVLQSAGIDPSEATAVASVIPKSDQVQVDLSSDLGGEKAPAGDSSKLLSSLPASSFAAFAFTGFNEQLEEAINSLDESGIPPDLGSNELKSTLSQAGIDLDKIVASLREGAVFAEGNNRSSLGGALVVTGNSSEAADAIGSLGTLLRGAHVPGITAVGGKASGFSVNNGGPSATPIVVVAKGDRIAVGYGLAPALAGLNAGSGATLSDKPGYKAAVAALGKTPISAFVDGPAALSLAEALVPRSKTEFWEAVPYLKKISYIGLGSGTNGELATATLIAGLGK
ncbi:MAG: hypothetical protein QOF85_636 [Solirubrobacterales bacterium]|jgi:hypothetical protein|nr:hypothetical protein [Solirubrobacterales bacterium]